MSHSNVLNETSGNCVQSAALICVPPAAVPQMLPHVADMLRSAMVRTGLGSYAALERSLVEGKALLWLAVDGEVMAACATELTVDESGKVCTLIAAGGTNARRWTALLAGIESYAKAEGCRAVRFYGRRGWLRHLPAYQQVGIVAETRL